MKYVECITQDKWNNIRKHELNVYFVKLLNIKLLATMRKDVEQQKQRKAPLNFLYRIYFLLQLLSTSVDFLP